MVFQTIDSYSCTICDQSVISDTLIAGLCGHTYTVAASGRFLTEISTIRSSLTMIPGAAPLGGWKAVPR